MGRKYKAVARRRIDDYTERALAADVAGLTIAPGVYLPPAIRGKGLNVTYSSAGAEIVDIKKNMVKIAMEADPIGQLTAIANGQPVAFFDVSEDGKLSISYATPSMTQRINILKFLADRVMPRISVTKKFTDPDGAGPADDWTATMENAAIRDEDDDLS